MLARLVSIAVYLLLLPLNPVYMAICGCQSCTKTKSDVINIHVVPHSHLDVGWIYTKDEYYYGANSVPGGIRGIFDSVVDSLAKNPSRRFIFVETAYLWPWLQEQSEDRLKIVRTLVNNGRLEIVGGGWTMNDEAVTHYQSIVDQFTWGFRRLNETLGACATPTIGWQIDPFGHSRENAAIMAKMGFDGLFLGRIDYKAKVSRRFNKAYEMIWHTSENDLSDHSKIFTSILYNQYEPPEAVCSDGDFCLEYDFTSEDIEALKTEMISEMAPLYRTRNVMLTMGSDLNYQQAEKNFANLDKLIRYLNRLYRNQLYVFYSTPSCYLNAVNEAKIEMPSKADDFFPYASKQNEYWAGYFTSRPTLKRFERIGNNFLQVGKQILAMANSPLSLDISRAKEAMGVMQHHDAITGTSREYVAHDYARLLTNALEKVMQASSKALNTLVRAPYQPVREPEFQSCFLLNISTCHMTEDVQSFVVTVYNPLSRNVNKLVRLPISSTQLSWIVHGPEDENLPVQMVPIPDFLFYIPGRRLVETVEIVFIAENLPPLGYKSYYVESSNTENENFFRSKLVNVNENNISVGYNNGIMVTIDQNGKIDSIKTKGAAKETPFTQEFAYYHGANQPEEFQVNKQSWSGAYIFRPTGTAVTVTDQPKTTIVQGPIVTEIQQTISSWINQVIRLLNGADYVEFQWTVGPIPFKIRHEKNGKEVITRYKIPTLKNGGVFYTDSNGREMIRRNLQRWSVDVTEPIPGNYYPVTTRINIKDTEDPTKSLTVVTDRSEGGTSLEDGTIELMLHRRLKLDDRKGVDQPLDEMAFDQPLVAVGSHYISLEPSHKTTLLNQEKVLDAWIFISPANGVSYDQWKTYYLMEFSGLNHALPDNVQILTLERWEDGENGNKIYLLRLENIMDRRENSTVMEVNLKDLFKTFTIVNVKEMMLGANIPIEMSDLRLKWKQENDIPLKSRRGTNQSNSGDILTGKIMLKPMEIRTFLIEIKPRRF